MATLSRAVPQKGVMRSHHGRTSHGHCKHRRQAVLRVLDAQACYKAYRFVPRIGDVGAHTSRLQFHPCCHTGSSETTRYTVRIARALQEKECAEEAREPQRSQRRPSEDLNGPPFTGWAFFCARGLHRTPELLDIALPSKARKPGEPNATLLRWALTRTTRPRRAGAANSRSGPPCLKPPLMYCPRW